MYFHSYQDYSRKLSLILSNCDKDNTRGSRKLLTDRFVHPFGWEMPSSYSAGSQRAKGVFDAPRRGLFLKGNKKCQCLETLLKKSQV